MDVLVDTGAWYALADRSDRHHKAAREFYERQAGTAALITTDLILAEKTRTSWCIASALGAVRGSGAILDK